MPYYSDHFENSEQDWEPVNWKQDSIKTKKNIEKENVPFYRKLINARQKAQITRHKLAQSLGIKIKKLELYETGKELPENKVLARINRILGSFHDSVRLRKPSPTDDNLLT